MTAAATLTTGYDFVTRLPETIRTTRLVLRAPSRDDVASMVRLSNNQNIYKWLSRLPNPYREADAIAFIDTIARGPEEHAYSILTSDGGFIGVTSLMHYEEGPAELGYWLGEPYWGLGYASEAVSGLLAAADSAGCDRIVASAQSSNFASCRVLEKSGFAETSRRIADHGPRKGVSVTYFLREGLR